MSDSKYLSDNYVGTAKRLRELNACDPLCDGRCKECPDDVARSAADQIDALERALRALLAQVSNIEVLGEWSALDINPTSSKKTRAKVDEVIAAARAALKGSLHV